MRESKLTSKNPSKGTLEPKKYQDLCGWLYLVIHVKVKPVILSHSNAPPTGQWGHLDDRAASSRPSPLWPCSHRVLLERRHAGSLSIPWSGVLFRCQTELQIDLLYRSKLQQVHRETWMTKSTSFPGRPVPLAPPPGFALQLTTQDHRIRGGNESNLV